MKNVYDITHELVLSLKETDQYKNYIYYKAQIDKDLRLKKMLEDFQQQNIAFQAQMMSGKNDEALKAKIQSLYSIVMSDPKAAAFLQAQMTLSQIIGDIYKEIGEVLNA